MHRRVPCPVHRPKFPGQQEKRPKISGPPFFRGHTVAAKNFSAQQRTVPKIFRAGCFAARIFSNRKKSRRKFFAAKKDPVIFGSQS